MKLIEGTALIACVGLVLGWQAASGVYVIIATSLGMGGTGDYEFFVTRKQ